MENSRYKNYLDSLRKNSKVDTATIESGVSECEKLIKEKNKLISVFFEPNSNKNEFLLALIGKLLDYDSNYETVYIITSDNFILDHYLFNLFKQCNEINLPVVMFYTDYKISQLKFHNKKRVIFCKKDKYDLTHLIHSTKNLNNRIVIDAEIDCPYKNNSYYEHRAWRERHRIKKLISKLLRKNGVYLELSSLPEKKYFSFSYNISTKPVFVSPDKEYKGRNYFFPLNSTNNNVITYDCTSKENVVMNQMIDYIIKATYLYLSGDHKKYNMILGVNSKDSYSHYLISHKSIINTIFDLANNSKLLNLIELRITKFINKYKIDKKYNKSLIINYIIENISNFNVLELNDKHNFNLDDLINPKCLYNFVLYYIDINLDEIPLRNILSFCFNKAYDNYNDSGREFLQTTKIFGFMPKFTELIDISMHYKDYNKYLLFAANYELALNLIKKDNKYISFMDINFNQKKHVYTGYEDKKYVYFYINNEFEVCEKFYCLTDRGNVESFVFNNRDDPINCLQKMHDKGIVESNKIYMGFLDYLKNLKLKNIYDIRLCLDGRKFYEVDDLDKIKFDKEYLLKKYIFPKYDNSKHLIIPFIDNNGYCKFIYSGFVDICFKEIKDK